MTNFEYWKDRILEITEHDGLAVYSDKPLPCKEVNCSLCISNVDTADTDVGCERHIIKWLYSEHEEKPKLTKRERKLCEALETGWIAADEGGAVYWYRNLPVKESIMYKGGGTSMYLSGAGFQFDFIDFEDEEPWMVENLLQLEVEE